MCIRDSRRLRRLLLFQVCRNLPPLPISRGIKWSCCSSVCLSHGHIAENRCVLDRCHTCNFCRATLSRDNIASVTWHVAQMLNSHATPFRLEQRCILCNFVAKMRWTLIGQFLFMRQSCSVRHGWSHWRFCRAIKLLDKIARQNCRCDIRLRAMVT